MLHYRSPVFLLRPTIFCRAKTDLIKFVAASCALVFRTTLILIKTVFPYLREVFIYLSSRIIRYLITTCADITKTSKLAVSSIQCVFAHLPYNDTSPLFAFPFNSLQRLFLLSLYSTSKVQTKEDKEYSIDVKKNL